MKTVSFIKILDPKNYEKTNFHTYQRLIRKLIYLSCSIKPDILFIIEQFNKHNANPRKKHLWATKRVVRHLKRTIKMRLIFGQKSKAQLPRDLLPYELIDYVNSNFAEDLENRKSVIGYYFFLNRSVIF